MKVRLPLDPDRRNAVGAVSTGALSPGIDRAASRVLTEAIAIGSLDPVTGELIRWRNARRQDCQLCQSHRDEAARSAGVTDATLDAVDHFESSDFTQDRPGVGRKPLTKYCNSPFDRKAATLELPRFNGKTGREML